MNLNCDIPTRIFNMIKATIQLEDSGWRVDVVFGSDQKMTFSMGYHISIKGNYIE